MVRLTRIAIAAAGTLALGATLAGVPGTVNAAEVTLKAVSAFGKSHARTLVFRDFIKRLNAAGKGVIQIQFLGGPEITPPSKQPLALRNGLFDLQYGPPAYYLGMLPEGDALDGFKLPAQSRKVGGFKYFDKALRAKLGATFIGRFDAGSGLYLFLKSKPPLRADGLPDLKGLKIRTSPAYVDFIKQLGGTAVVMRMGQAYAALERGVVDGAATGLTGVRSLGLQKFLKVRVEPNFSLTSLIMIGNAKKIDSLPAAARKTLYDQALKFEDISMKNVMAFEEKEKQVLAKAGQEALVLKGAAGQKYIDTYLHYPWKRLAENPKVMLDAKTLEKAFR